MLQKIEYKYLNIESLKDLLLFGIVGLAVIKDTHRPINVWLILADGKAIKISSVVSSIDSWDELGSLVFELIDEGSTPPSGIIKLNDDWLDIKLMEKLIYKDKKVEAESGLVINNSIGDKIIIVSSSFPNSIEISSPIYSDDFEPECDIDDYLLEDL